MFFGGLGYHGQRPHIFETNILFWLCRRRRQGQTTIRFLKMCGFLAVVLQASKTTWPQTQIGIPVTLSEGQFCKHRPTCNGGCRSGPSTVCKPQACDPHRAQTGAAFQINGGDFIEVVKGRNLNTNISFSGFLGPFPAAKRPDKAQETAESLVGWHPVHLILPSLWARPKRSGPRAIWRSIYEGNPYPCLPR
jgi:hypothetical protein